MIKIVKKSFSLGAFTKPKSANLSQKQAFLQKKSTIQEKKPVEKPLDLELILSDFLKKISFLHEKFSQNTGNSYNFQRNKSEELYKELEYVKNLTKNALRKAFLSKRGEIVFFLQENFKKMVSQRKNPGLIKLLEKYRGILIEDLEKEVKEKEVEKDEKVEKKNEKHKENTEKTKESPEKIKENTENTKEKKPEKTKEIFKGTPAKLSKENTLKATKKPLVSLKKPQEKPYIQYYLNKKSNFLYRKQFFSSFASEKLPETDHSIIKLLLFLYLKFH